MSNKLSIEYPDNDRIDQSIDYIVNMVYDNKTNVFKEFFHMTQTISIRNLFVSKVPLIVTVLIYLVVIYSLQDGHLYQNQAHFYILISILSPTTFIIGLSDILLVKNLPILSLEMTTRYSFQQLAIYKMVILLVYHILMNTIIFYISWNLSHFEFHLFESIFLMTAHLFLSSSIALYIVLRFNQRLIPYVCLFFWYGMVIVMAYRFPQIYGSPVWLLTSHLIASVIAVMLHYKQYQFIKQKTFLEEGYGC